MVHGLFNHFEIWAPYNLMVPVVTNYLYVVRSGLPKT